MLQVLFLLFVFVTDVRSIFIFAAKVLPAICVRERPSHSPCRTLSLASKQAGRQAALLSCSFSYPQVANEWGQGGSGSGSGDYICVCLYLFRRRHRRAAAAAAVAVVAVVSAHVLGVSPGSCSRVSSPPLYV